jgi:hypothetical protein
MKALINLEDKEHKSGGNKYAGIDECDHQARCSASPRRSAISCSISLHDHNGSPDATMRSRMRNNRLPNGVRGVAGTASLPGLLSSGSFIAVPKPASNGLARQSE